MNFLDYMKDIDYIEKVKKAETSNGDMEKLAIKYLEILEFIYFNEKKLGEDIEKISIKEYDSYINEIRNGELNKFLRKYDQIYLVSAALAPRNALTAVKFSILSFFWSRNPKRQYY